MCCPLRIGVDAARLVLCCRRPFASALPTVMNHKKKKKKINNKQKYKKETQAPQ
jgi:hypothetical protein